MDALSKLSRFPNFAILDVSPGGGKTTSILTDIGMMLEAKKASKFLVMCPTRLAKNWIEDMHKHTEGKWNFIPLTTEVYNRWGEEKLAELIEKRARVVWEMDLGDGETVIVAQSLEDLIRVVD